MSVPLDSELHQVYPLVINGNSLVSSIYNNQYRYTPPAGAFTFPKGSSVSVGSIAIFYSWFNFSTSYDNNSFTISFSGSSPLAINIGNQSLTVAQLNSYIQQQMISAGLYLINSSGQNVYYAEILENPSAYAIQLNVFPVPSALPAGWTNGGSLVLSGFAPQFIIPSTNIQQSLGFTAASYPSSATTTTTQSFLSSSTPQLSPVESILVGCSLLRNYYNQNPTVLYSFTSTGTTFGNLITTSPTFPMYTPIYPGVYSYIDIFFYDQNNNPLPINDTNLTITLLLKVPENI